MQTIVLTVDRMIAGRHHTAGATLRVPDEIDLDHASGLVIDGLADVGNATPLAAIAAGGGTEPPASRPRRARAGADITVAPDPGTIQAN